MLTQAGEIGAAPGEDRTFSALRPWIAGSAAVASAAPASAVQVPVVRARASPRPVAVWPGEIPRHQANKKAAAWVPWGLDWGVREGLLTPTPLAPAAHPTQPVAAGASDRGVSPGWRARHPSSAAPTLFPLAMSPRATRLHKGSAPHLGRGSRILPFSERGEECPGVEPRDTMARQPSARAVGTALVHPPITTPARHVSSTLGGGTGAGGRQDVSMSCRSCEPQPPTAVSEATGRSNSAHARRPSGSTPARLLEEGHGPLTSSAPWSCQPYTTVVLAVASSRPYTEGGRHPSPRPSTEPSGRRTRHGRHTDRLAAPPSRTMAAGLSHGRAMGGAAEASPRAMWSGVQRAGDSAAAAEAGALAKEAGRDGPDPPRRIVSTESTARRDTTGGGNTAGGADIAGGGSRGLGVAAGSGARGWDAARLAASIRGLGDDYVWIADGLQAAGVTGELAARLDAAWLVGMGVRDLRIVRGVTAHLRRVMAGETPEVAPGEMPVVAAGERRRLEEHVPAKAGGSSGTFSHKGALEREEGGTRVAAAGKREEEDGPHGGEMLGGLRVEPAIVAEEGAAEGTIGGAVACRDEARLGCGVAGIRSSSPDQVAAPRACGVSAELAREAHARSVADAAVHTKGLPAVGGSSTPPASNVGPVGSHILGPSATLGPGGSSVGQALEISAAGPSGLGAAAQSPRLHSLTVPSAQPQRAQPPQPPGVSGFKKILIRATAEVEAASDLRFVLWPPSRQADAAGAADGGQPSQRGSMASASLTPPTEGQVMALVSRLRSHYALLNRRADKEAESRAAPPPLLRSLNLTAKVVFHTASARRGSAPAFEVGGRPQRCVAELRAPGVLVLEEADGGVGDGDVSRHASMNASDQGGWGAPGSGAGAVEAARDGAKRGGAAGGGAAGREMRHASRMGPVCLPLLGCYARLDPTGPHTPPVLAAHVGGSSLLASPGAFAFAVADASAPSTAPTASASGTAVPGTTAPPAFSTAGPPPEAHPRSAAGIRPARPSSVPPPPRKPFLFGTAGSCALSLRSAGEDGLGISIPRAPAFQNQSLPRSARRAAPGWPTAPVGDGRPTATSNHKPSSWSVGGEAAAPAALLEGGAGARCSGAGSSACCVASGTSGYSAGSGAVLAPGAQTDAGEFTAPSCSTIFAGSTSIPRPVPRPTAGLDGTECMWAPLSFEALACLGFDTGVGLDDGRRLASTWLASCCVVARCLAASVLHESKLVMAWASHLAAVEAASARHDAACRAAARRASASVLSGDGAGVGGGTGEKRSPTSSQPPMPSLKLAILMLHPPAPTRAAEELAAIVDEIAAAEMPTPLRASIPNGVNGASGVNGPGCPFNLIAASFSSAPTVSPPSPPQRGGGARAPLPRVRVMRPHRPNAAARRDAMVVLERRAAHAADMRRNAAALAALHLEEEGEEEGGREEEEEQRGEGDAFGLAGRKDSWSSCSKEEEEDGEEGRGDEGDWTEEDGEDEDGGASVASDEAGPESALALPGLEVGILPDPAGEGADISLLEPEVPVLGSGMEADVGMEAGAASQAGAAAEEVARAEAKAVAASPSAHAISPAPAALLSLASSTAARAVAAPAPPATAPTTVRTLSRECISLQAEIERTRSRALCGLSHLDRPTVNLPSPGRPSAPRLHQRPVGSDPRAASALLVVSGSQMRAVDVASDTSGAVFVRVEVSRGLLLSDRWPPLTLLGALPGLSPAAEAACGFRGSDAAAVRDRCGLRLILASSQLELIASSAAEAEAWITGINWLPLGSKHLALAGHAALTHPELARSRTDGGDPRAGDVASALGPCGDPGEDELRTAFRVFDRDGSGSVSNAELRAILQAVGERRSEAELEAMMVAADNDSDGTINYAEFRKLMNGF